uniref:Glycosyltransferase n=1 Tax=Thermodesulfobacterium geofontis TaxID=1295609 RepID=A0A7V5XEW3_9BACT
MKNSLAKADLHLHSKASNKPGGWFTQLIGCPESFVKPKEIYYRLKKRDMTYITITDHNTIEGVLEIAHFPEVFISAEYTVFFPEEEASAHVLVYGIDENIHQDLIKLRENIYEFTTYLKEKDIPHSLAHPLYSVQGSQITVSLVEKFVLLFDNWEIINGTRGERLKTLEEKLARTYDGWDKIYKLEEKYGLKSLRSRPNIGFTAGTDDHGGLDVGKTWTEALAESKEDFLKAIKEGRTSVSTQAIGYERLLNTVGIIGYHFFSTKEKFPSNTKSPFDFVFKQSKGFLRELCVKNLLRVNGNGKHVLKEALNKFPTLSLRKLIRDFSPPDLGNTILSLFLHSLPLILLSIQRRDEVQAERTVKSLGIEVEKPLRLAYITDTYFEINGVARSTQTVKKLAEDYNLPLDVITVGEGKEKGNLKLLKPMVELSTPFYTEFKLRIPSLIELTDLLKDYTKVHVATPGSLGILSFLVAKALNIPVSTAFHTDIAVYAFNYTKSLEIRELLYQSLVVFHNLSEKVFVPSKTYKKLLIEKGVKAEKIRIFKRGVNTEFFNPAKREEDYFKKHFNIPVKGKVILYVGRVSKEKNLDTFLYCAKIFPEETFIIVGDGPYRKELEKKKTENVYTLGYLTGEELAKAYASSDIFLFPSETETYGFVILEAMASGLPVIVSSKGASSEHVQKEINGFIASTKEEFAESLSKLLIFEELRKAVARQALEYARSLDLKKSYLDYLNALLEFSDTTPSFSPLPFENSLLFTLLTGAKA